MDDRLTVYDIAHLHLFAPKLPRETPSTANPVDQETMKIQEITLRKHRIALTPQAVDRIEGAQIVAELPLGIAQLTRGSFVSQRKGFFERQRVALDLKTGQRFLNMGAAADLRDPIGTQLHRLQEPRGLLDRLQLAEHSGRDPQLGFECHGGCIGGVGPLPYTKREASSGSPNRRWNRPKIPLRAVRSGSRGAGWHPMGTHLQGPMHFFAPHQSPEVHGDRRRKKPHRLVLVQSRAWA